MIRGLIILTAALSMSRASATQSLDLEYRMYFKAFCKNDAKEVEVAEIEEPIVYHFELNEDGTTKSAQPQVFHMLESAGYQVYVSLEILREVGMPNFHIRLTPWRKVNDERDISYGTAFVEQAQPTPLANLGVAVNEEINEATGSYCTLTATIASK